ncbi:DNA-directed RNA polymerase III subunit rpc4 [Drechslerella dactyloides]|uniref:DNA-directed RNA polymerase III subunit rpc4 n=1 Tax=Drechslerella dactyloides TaxID=74499 RepID=A0AAD6NI66_DREDA|nr:DNA-directed RNA polymerase III subunit rpc4 [Drechslerella dactyloides]
MPPRGRGRPARATRAAAAATADADVPTTSAAAEEPAESTPLAIPPPSGRLEGLTNPSSSAGRGVAGGSAGSPPLAPGERPRPKLKFAPKNTARKTKEEREQLNRLYEPTVPDDSLSAFGVTRGGPSGRGARGRGRGRGGAGRGDGRREEVAVASGPFALGSVMTAGGKQKVSIERMSRFNRTAGRSGSSRVKREGDDGTLVKGEYSSSDDSEGGPKVDVEMIDLISSSDSEGAGGADGDEADTKERKPSGRGFAPVRIERHEHIDRMAQTGDAKKKGDAAAAAGKKDKGKGKEREVEITEERKVRGRRDSGTGPRVKIEPESPKATRRSTRSPEQVRKKQQSSSPEDRRRKPKARSQSRNRKTGIVPQSQEDFEENDRYDVDRFSMLRELGPALPERGPVDADGDHAMGEDAPVPQAPHDEKENKLYLFQFPPVLPVLEPAAAVEDAADVTIKEENPAAAPAAPAAGPSTATQRAGEGSTAHTGASRAADVKTIKDRFATLEEVQRAKLPAGTAGKLQVHRSGRVTIVFGGVEFEVHRGVDCDFLQDVVVLQKESGAVDERGRPKGRAWGMGQLKGKFVATPDITKMGGSLFPFDSKMHPKGLLFSLLLLCLAAFSAVLASPIAVNRRDIAVANANDGSNIDIATSGLVELASIADETPTGSRFDIEATAQRPGLIKRLATRVLGRLGVPDSMMQLIAAVPDDLLKKMIRQPLGQLKGTLDTLKAGKIPQVPGVSPKELILQVLPNLNVPPAMVDLIKAAPDALVQKMVDLPGTQLQGLITQLQQGKIPTIPGISQKELVLQFLPNLGVPPAIVNLIQVAPDSLVQQITSLPADQLQNVINDLKQGKLPNLPGGLLPGLIGGLPGTNTTVPAPRVRL